MYRQQFLSNIKEKFVQHGNCDAQRDSSVEPSVKGDSYEVVGTTEGERDTQRGSGDELVTKEGLGASRLA